MGGVEGRCDARFAPLHEVLTSNLAAGADLGASVAVVLDGELVVDLWGGWADIDKRSAWTADTITNVWSSTKTMTSLAALVLVDRGELDLDARVARYWPEFAAKGKQDVRVKQLLAHTSGVSAWEQPVQVTDIYDWDESTARLAAQAPWWQPGSASGYHALNQGHLVGEVIRRITGLKLGEFFAREIAAPLAADFHIGLAAEHDARVADVVPPPPLPFDLEALDVQSPMYKTFTGPAPDASVAWTSAWRRADIGAANGHGNARSVARCQAVISHGGEFDGVRLLGPATIARIFETQADGIDVVLGIPLIFGIGYGLPEPTTAPWLPQGRVCFWGGWGGSLVVNDLERRMTFAYMMNRMGEGIIGGPRAEALLRAAYTALG